MRGATADETRPIITFSLGQESFSSFSRLSKRSCRITRCRHFRFSHFCSRDSGWSKERRLPNYRRRLKDPVPCSGEQPQRALAFILRSLFLPLRSARDTFPLGNF